MFVVVCDRFFASELSRMPLLSAIDVLADARLVHLQHVIAREAEAGRPAEALVADGGGGQADARDTLIDLLAPGVLLPRRADVERRRPDLRLIIDLRGHGAERRICIHRVLAMHRGVRLEVDVRGEMVVAPEVLLMRPAHRLVIRPIELVGVCRADPAAQKAVEPLVVEVHVDAQPTGIQVGTARAAAPVDPARHVVVFIRRPVVAEVVDVAAITRTVAHDVAESELRRQESRCAVRGADP